MTNIFNKIIKNRLIQAVTALLLLSLTLYVICLCFSVSLDYLSILSFLLWRLSFTLLFLSVLIALSEFPSVKTFQADYEVFNKGPENKSPFITFLRKYHILIFFISIISYSLATSFFLDNEVVSYCFGTISFVFAILYFTQFVIYIKAFIKKPLKSSISPPSVKKKMGIKIIQIVVVSSERCLAE